MDAKKILKRELLCEMARRDFYTYCKLLFPEFYIETRTYLKDLCNLMQKRPKKLMINMPPRSGKSLTLTLFETWLLGQNQEERIISVSYNETLSSRFSKGVRNTIEAERIDEDMFVFSDIFPHVKIKRGDASYQLWSLEGQYFNFIGSGIGSSITGIGCSLLVIDDVIKNAKEAYTEHVLESHFNFYKNTLLSRLETGGSIIINMTRWVENDLCGKILDDVEDKEDWIVYQIQMEQVDGEPLCDNLMSKEEMEDKKKTMSQEIWFANYQQQILITGNRMYKEGFKIFTEWDDKIPRQIILDVADKGSDYVAGVCFAEDGATYDVYSTFLNNTELADIEDKIVKWILDTDAKVVWVESNNVGNYFSRQLRKKLTSVVIKTYTTISNKEARIKSAQWWVQEHVRFHKSLKTTDFVTQIVSFKTPLSANKHDDAVDCLTVIYDLFGKRDKATAGVRI